MSPQQVLSLIGSYMNDSIPITKLGFKCDFAKYLVSQLFDNRYAKKEKKKELLSFNTLDIHTVSIFLKLFS